MTDNDHNAGTGQSAAIRNKSEEVLREGRDAAQGVLKEGQAKAEELLDQQKSNIAKQVKSFAEVSRNAASDLRDREQSLAADWVEAAADGAENMANQLRDSDLKGVYDQVSGFARRQPAVFIAGAALLGFAAARFASATASPQTRSTTTTYAAPTSLDRPVQGERPPLPAYNRNDGGLKG